MSMVGMQHRLALRSSHEQSNQAHESMVTYRLPFTLVHKICIKLKRQGV